MTYLQQGNPATMQLRDAQPGEIVYVQERIGDDRNSLETREVFYRRRNDIECRHPNNVPVARLAIVQGDEAPRYVRVCDPPCRDPGEADGRITVHRVADGKSRWWHIWKD